MQQANVLRKMHQCVNAMAMWLHLHQSSFSPMHIFIFKELILKLYLFVTVVWKTNIKEAVIRPCQKIKQ